MAVVDARELHEHTNEVLRRVWERREPIDVTLSDAVVARLVPVAPTDDEEALAAWWDGIDRLADEISAFWPKGVSAAQAVAEERREL